MSSGTYVGPLSSQVQEGTPQQDVSWDIRPRPPMWLSETHDLGTVASQLKRECSGTHVKTTTP